MQRRRAFTLIELLVVIAIIAILAAILFPVFAQARGKAWQAQCAANFRQVGQAMLMYCQDHDEVLPLYYDINTPRQIIQPYIKNFDVVQRCPAATDIVRGNPTAPPSQYRWSGLGLNGISRSAGYPSPPFNYPASGIAGYSTALGNESSLPMVDQPASCVWAADWWAPMLTSSGNNDTNIRLVPCSYAFYGGRHSGMNNVLFVDGHVKLMKMQQLKTPESFAIEGAPPPGWCAANNNACVQPGVTWEGRQYCEPLG